MNSLLIDPLNIFDRKENKIFVRSSKIATHIENVLNKTNVNKFQHYKITILNEGIYYAEVTRLLNSELCFEIKEPLQCFEPWIDIVVGVSRPQTTKKILEHGSTYGVGKFHFFTASLSEKSYLDSKVFTDEKDNLLHDGLSQSARYYQAPEVVLDHYNPAKKYAEYDYKFILDFDNAKSFLDVEVPNLYGINKKTMMPKIVLAIGPERGFRQEDIEPFLAHGFQKVTISQAVLRVEHALYSSLGQLELLTKKY